MATRMAVACAITLALAASANAQTGSTSSTTTDDTRPATTTFLGDTGLWFAPTAEVLPAGKWSVSGYRRGTNYIQGYSNVADFAGTFAVGIKNRAEIFGSFLVDTRIDRDVRPLFVNDPTYGGFIDRYPLMNTTWSGNNVGDLYLGAKVNLWSESRQNPAAIALRGIVKVPTGSTSAGVSTGKADVLFDFIASKEMMRKMELTGYAGYEFRGSPDGFSIPNKAFRWGGGAGFPSRSPLRVTAELNGYIPSADTASLTTAGILIGTDGSLPPTVSNTENLTRATLALTYQAHNGFFLGAGLSKNLPQLVRLANRTDEMETGDYWDFQFRVGFHPGVRVYVPPPPPPPPAPVRAAAPPPPAHDLSVKAACDPCTVEVGMTSTVTATVQDSIACAVTYRWTAPTGTFQNPTNRQTIWTATQQTGVVPATVTVTCPSDNKTATDTVNITVIRTPAKTYAFDDVYFDFDRYSLRPEATRVLDEAITAMRGDAMLKLQIEGHTCNIGTAEYNLALGDRRATAVRDYLISRGVTADRLTTISYGEERPKYDNAREETRRLNRRAVLVVNLQR
jgi:outer membrane protein OmpA-like peptidoglycan-associated protein